MGFRNNVAGKGPLGAGRVPVQRVQDSGSPQQLAEIPVAHGLGSRGVNLLDLLARAVAFVIRHEEEPVFSVECARNREGAAHCEAELVLLKRGSLRHQRGETERPRIERAVAKKFPDRAVVIVRAALGRDIHLANAPPEFRGINAGLDFELLNGIHRGQEQVGVEVGFGVGDPVDAVVIEFTAGTRNRERLIGAVATQSRAGGPGAGASVDVEGRADIRTEAHQLQKIAPVQRQINNAFVVDDRADAGVLRVEQRSTAGNFDGFGDCAHPELEIETGGLLYLQLNLRADFGLKPLDLSPDIVHPRHQSRKTVIPRRVARDFPDQIRGRVGNGDACVGHYSASGVGDHSGDFAESLPEGRQRQCCR